jgi:hypothetical protein
MSCPFLDEDRLKCKAVKLRAGTSYPYSTMYGDLTLSDVKKCRVVWKQCSYYRKKETP